MALNPQYRNSRFGTAHQQIVESVKHKPYFAAFKAGTLSQEQFFQAIVRDEAALEASGLPENKIHLLGRFPANEELAVDYILAEWKAADLIPSTDYDRAAFAVYREKVHKNYDHGGLQTYIFPEEERLMFALGQILNPKRALFLGSYYGYWASWLMPTLQANGGQALLVDMDQEVSGTAAKNMHEMQFHLAAKAVCQEGTAFLRECRETFDFVVLDAEGPEDSPDPRYRGKHIYEPLAEAALPFIERGKYVFAHNIMRQNLTTDPVMERRIAKHDHEFELFYPLMNRHFAWRSSETTEGVAIFRKKCSLQNNP